MKRVLILGSTGSIGTQVLDVIGQNPGRFRVAGLSAGRNGGLLARQAAAFNAPLAALEEGEWDGPCPAFTGEGAALRLCKEVQADLAVVSVVGCAGLPLVLACLEAGMDIALANKESLVAGGTFVMRTARRLGRMILPVDSEHSAIFQCLESRPGEKAHKIHLTASGGPFFGKSKEELRGVTAAQALCHPNWTMGAKVTADSATMMNKGLEVIEAAHLFAIPPGKIQVAVHPTSIVHSLVEFDDGVVMAQLGVPDMRTPIQYALFYPEFSPVRPAPALDLFSSSPLAFYPPDRETFPCLALAEQAAKEGGTAPAALNAANEVAVEAFLAGKLHFYGIASVVEEALEKFSGPEAASPEEVLALDCEVRRWGRLRLERSV